VVEAVTRQVARGSASAASTPEEVALAELLVSRVPALERVRFGNSGTEAVMMAIKAARAYTGRDRRVRGAYHGTPRRDFNSRAGEADEPGEPPSAADPQARVWRPRLLNGRDAKRLITRTERRRP
jgi:glutamate-1-semialdehyde aminotransferase